MKSSRLTRGVPKRRWCIGCIARLEPQSFPDRLVHRTPKLDLPQVLALTFRDLEDHIELDLSCRQRGDIA